MAHIHYQDAADSRSLSSIPTELLDKICALFCPHCSMPQNRHSTAYLVREERRRMRKDLLSLCLVSRRTRAVAQPVLFHVLYHSDIRDPPSNFGWPRYIVQFLRSIIQNPRLGGCVREVEFSTFSFLEVYKTILAHDFSGAYENASDTFRDCVIASLTEQIVRLFDDARERLGLPAFDWAVVGPKINRRRGEKLLDLLTVLLVAHTPNATYLSLALDDDCSPWLRRALESVGTWSMLTTLKCRARDSSVDSGNSPAMIASLRSVMPLLQGSPKLDALHLKGFGNRDVGFEDATFAGVRKLSITSGSMSYQTLQTNLRAFPNIRDFKYKSGGVPDADPEGWRYVAIEVSPAEVVSLLEPVRTSLTALSLDLRKATFFSKPDAAVRSLKEFEALEWLEIDYESSLSGHRQSPTELHDILGPDYEAPGLEESWDDIKAFAEPGEHLLQLLPANIERVSLRGCGFAEEMDLREDVFQDIERLVAAAGQGGRFPRLVEVEFRRWDGHVLLLHQHLRTLHNIFKDSGVALKCDYSVTHYWGEDDQFEDDDGDETWEDCEESEFESSHGSRDGF